MDKITKNFLAFVANKTEQFDKDTLSILSSDIIKITTKGYENYLHVTDGKTLLNNEYFIPENYDDFIYTFSPKYKADYSEYYSYVTMSYPEQLKHAKWKEKRNEVVEERGSKCERCGSKEFLQVHHKQYLKDKLAWEYENDMLECLCGGCHMKEHNITKETKKDDWLKRNSMCYDEMFDLGKLKALIMMNLADPVVNQLITLNAVVSQNNTTIYFENSDRKRSDYIKKLFGDRVICNYREIGFNIKKCTRELDLRLLAEKNKKK